MVADMTRAYVLLPKTPIGAKRLIFKGSAMSGFAIIWREPRRVELSFTDGYVVECQPSAQLSAEIQITVAGCKPGRVGPR
jgi:hypothetical protein